MGRLTPAVAFGGSTYWIGLHQLVSVDRSVLGEELGVVDARDAVIRGFDLLFTGF